MGNSKNISELETKYIISHIYIYIFNVHVAVDRNGAQSLHIQIYIYTCIMGGWPQSVSPFRFS